MGLTVRVGSQSNSVQGGRMGAIVGQFRAFAAMGYTLTEACEACPPEHRVKRDLLLSGLRDEGVVFPDQRDSSKRAKSYPRKGAKQQSIAQAIRETRAPITPQAVRYRVKTMGMSLDAALTMPMMSRSEAGRLGAIQCGHVQADGQLVFRFLRL